MTYNPLMKLSEAGQSIWLDYLRRDMLESGELRRLIEQEGLRGMTSNPSIFWKAIDGSDDYTAAIKALAEAGKSKEEVYRQLTVEDVRQAADQFRPLFDKVNGDDGFVSLEVNPHLARDVEGTINEAKELWTALARPNVFIKVPATTEGLESVRQLIAAGINVNVTLLFGLNRYREVADAYLSGLEDRVKNGESLDGIHSVASFFLSRIDVKVDPLLEKIIDAGGDKAVAAETIHGEVAIASAKIAYQIYREMFESERFRKLADQGARPQRLLWASTGTKNPDYSDIKYIEPLIGPNTINTVPRETLNAYRDHGNPSARIEDDVDKAKSVLSQLGKLDIDIDKISAELEDEGIAKFNKPYDKTLESLQKKIKASKEQPVDPQQMILGEYEQAVSRRIDKLNAAEFGRKLWDKDVSAWSDKKSTKEQIGNSLGWLYVAEKMISNVTELKTFASEVREDGFKHVVHLGMGGSSLAPLVFERTYEQGESGLPLDVLDSTDPESVLKIEKKVPLEKTLFIVASKSGSTAETITFMEYFFQRLTELKGDRAGENFVVITDPGSPLLKTAKSRHYRKIFLNYADIGGRYSALSYFGMVPAALMDLDIETMLERAVRMAHANQCQNSGAKNPAIELGAALGELATRGRDKLTLLTSRPIANFGLWLEQLIAESTGKENKGLLPVESERIGAPTVYGDDRIFVYFELQDEKYDSELEQVRRLAEAGHPVIIVRLDDKYDLGQEIMRWEIATATVGAVLGINPFDQPNVQAAKDNTGRLLDQVRTNGSLPEPDLGGSENTVLVEIADSALEDKLAGFLAQTEPGDYIGVQAYLAEANDVTIALQELRHFLRDNKRVATTVGYGPRYLHSTGQYHKGGPDSGLFIQIIRQSEDNVTVTDENYTFSVLINAQAQGDLEALCKRSCRVLRVDLGVELSDGLKRLVNAVTKYEHQPA